MASYSSSIQNRQDLFGHADFPKGGSFHCRQEGMTKVHYKGVTHLLQGWAPLSRCIRLARDAVEEFPHVFEPV